MSHQVPARIEPAIFYSKLIQFGIKLWGLCSANGYVFNFDVYCGKNECVEKLENCGLESCCENA